MSDKFEPIYVDLASESDDPYVTRIESLCFNCQKMGETRILMTHIPHYKEVILSSFECGHCGNRNTQVQPGQIQERGVRFELTVRSEPDLRRQVVRSDNAIVKIPELELEIPPEGEKGEITTVEGILSRTIDGLNRDQETRKSSHPELAEQIRIFIGRVQDMLDIKSPFTLVIEDPSGNSFIENIFAPRADPQLQQNFFERSHAQNEILGYQDRTAGDVDGRENTPLEGENLTEEVLNFNTLCDRCYRPVDTKMKVTAIPHFKEVVIMATNCDGCGHRTNEVKSGSGTAERGKRVALRITDPADMSRDVLKSETCSVEIPELELHVGGQLIGGKFTTLEGLLINIHDDLVDNPFLAGDSSDSSKKDIFSQLINDLNKASYIAVNFGTVIGNVIEGHSEVTIIMDDPAGNSYLQNVYAPEDDPNMVVTEYERNYEQNEELGLNDMKTENYITEEEQ